MLIVNCKFSPSLLNCERSISSTLKLSPTTKQNPFPISYEFSLSHGSETVHCFLARRPTKRKRLKGPKLTIQVPGKHGEGAIVLSSLAKDEGLSWELSVNKEETQRLGKASTLVSSVLCSSLAWVVPVQMAQASEHLTANAVYEVGELFELGIQLSYLVLLLALLGLGSYFVIRQVLVRRELDLSAKELQEQVRSGDASATELFELGAVMLRRKFYPAAIKYLVQAIEKWDGDDQDLAQVYNALGVTYMRDGKTEKAISQFESAVKLQPGYVTAWNNLGDAFEKTNDMKSALKAFEEALLFDPNNKVARPRRDALKQKVDMYKGVPVKTSKKK